MKDLMRFVEVIMAIGFFIAAAVLFNEGDDMYTRTAVHEVTETLYYVMSVLCAGFGALIISGVRK